MLKLHDFCNRARYSIGVGVTGFELDFWGRVRNLSDAARSQYLPTVQAERAFRLALIRAVASTYFASREADERIALADATVLRRHEGLRLAARLVEAGVDRTAGVKGQSRSVQVDLGGTRSITT